MAGFISDIKQSFKDKDYRHGYVDEFLNASIATQIKVLREQRGWGQKELADRAGMMQPRISVMENVNYSSWSIKILKKLAEAFDLTLCVYFEGFGKRVGHILRFSRENLERSSFPDDPYFKEQHKEEIPAQFPLAGIMGHSQQHAYGQVAGVQATEWIKAEERTSKTITDYYKHIPPVELKGAISAISGQRGGVNNEAAIH